MVWPQKLWKSGLTLHRVHSIRYQANDFNPNTSSMVDDVKNGGRFHPIEDEHGTRIPTLYLADHPQGALAETLLRDKKGRNRKLKFKDIDDKVLSTLVFKSSLKLVDICHHSLGDGFGDLLSQGYPVYRATRNLAASIYAREQWAQGIYWNGKQLGTQGLKCIMLFGNRVDKDLAEVIESVSLVNEPGVQVLRDAAAVRRFSLPEKLL